MIKTKGKSNVITNFPNTVTDEGGNTNNYVISGSIEQTSIPTPTNPVTPIECGDLVTSGEHQGKYQIPINVNGTTSYIYLDEPLRKIGIYSDIVSGTGSVIRRIYKYEITGNEVASYAPDGRECSMRLRNIDYINEAGDNVAICSHFKMLPSGNDAHNMDDNSAMMRTTDGLQGIWFRYDNAPDSGSSENNIVKFLKDQYRAGTPVTIWVAMWDEMISTTTAPTLTLVNGDNNINIDTTLAPSMMRINYNVEKLEESSYTEFPVEYTSNEGSLNKYSIDGNMSQTGTPTPDSPIIPNECGDKTENLWDNRGFSARAITSTYEHTDTNTYGTTLSTTIGKEVIVTQSAYPTGTVGYQNGFFFIDVDFSKYEIGDKVTISFDYICNEVHAVESQVTTTLYAGKNSNSIPVVLSSGKWSVSGRLTAVITVIADMNPYVEVRLCGNSITVKNIMLNEGSTALPYEPYGYRIPIETNKIYLNEPLYGIDSYKDSINGYTGECTRQIKKLVLTGTETWTYESQYTRFYTSFPNTLILGVRGTPAFCTHYQVISDSRPLADTPYNSMYSNSVNRVWFFKTEYTNVENWKAYLAQQYANGTPVTVWYILETPTTETITLPSNPPSSIKGYLTQSTTPTPTNPVYPTYNGKLKYNNKYEIFNTDGSEIGNIDYIYAKEPIRKIGDYYDTINSDGSINRIIGKLVLDGTEAWQFYSDSISTYGAWQFYVNSILSGMPYSSALSNIAEYGVTATSRANYPYGVYLVTSGTGVAFQTAGAKDTFTGISAWKSYLATQYANGTPVTVWYILNTPTTDTTITTPPTINTNKGLNTININTNLLPSKLTITYPIGEWIETYYNKLINNNITSNELPISFNSDSNSLNSISIKGNMNQDSDNLIPYPYSSNSQLLNGITWTVYNDGRVTASGESDGGTNFYFINVGKNITLKAGTYTLSFQGTKQNNLILRDADNSINIARINGTEKEVTFTINEDSGRCQLYFNTSSAGTTFNIDGYVMLNVGNTALPYQSYNPTPTSPITPSETGDRTENLFDISKVISSANVINQGASLKIITTSSSAGVVAKTPNKLKDYCPDLKVGDTVTLSLETTGSQKRIYLNMTGGTWLNNETKTITSEMLDAAVIWYASGVSTEAVVSKIMLNLGSTALPYEPYGYRISVETGYVYLDEPLYGIGNYNDTIDLETGVVTRYVKKIVLTGTESGWQSNDTVPNTDAFFSTSVFTGYKAHSGDGYCTHLLTADVYTGTESFIYFGLNINLAFNTSLNINTITAFKQFLSDQYNAGTPVTVYYILSTPITQTITIPIPTTGTIKGYLIQNGTPSPSNPIYPIGNGVVTENLCPISEFNKPSTYSSQYYIITLDKPLSAGTYTISALITPESGVTQARISFRKTDNTQEQVVNININRVGRSSATVTITNDVKSIYFYGGTVVTDYISISYSDIVLNEGNTPLNTYQPYGYRIPTINTNIYTKEPLRKVGEYSDVLNGDGSITRNIKKLVLTGGETIGYYQDIGYVRLPDDALQASIAPFCTHYIGSTLPSTERPDYSIRQMVTGYWGGEVVALQIKDSSLTSSGTLQNFLQVQYANGTPVTVWYTLTTPTTETITLPKIPTAIGTNIIDINTTLPPSEVTIETKQWKPTVPKIYHNGVWNYNWETFRELVRSGNAEKVFPIGTILYEEWGNPNSTAYQIVAYNKHFDSKLTALGYTYSVTLCQVFVISSTPFDAIEALLAVTKTAMPAGTYRFTIPNYDPSYGGNKTYIFTTNANIPVNGQLTLTWEYQKNPASVSAYSSSTSTTNLFGSPIAITEWNGTDAATDLGTVTYSTTPTTNTYGIFNHIHRARYGSNNYYQSAIRQYINSNATANNWWKPQTIFDRPPSYANRAGYLNTTNGYMKNSDLQSVLATPTISSVTNQIFEYVSLDGTTFTPSTSTTAFNTYDVNDKIFLLSHTEVNLSTNPNIGSVLDYYIDADNTKRIKYDISSGTRSITGDITNVGAVENPIIEGSTARYWWFRIPYPSGAYYERDCNTSGALGSGIVYGGYGCVPACVIQ